MLRVLFENRRHRVKNLEASRNRGRSGGKDEQTGK